MGFFDFLKKKKPSTEVEKAFEHLHIELTARQMVDKAISYRNVGQYDRAIYLLKDVLKRYPLYTPAKTVLGTTLMAKGDIEEAERQFKKILTEHADGKDYPLIEVYANLGSLYNNHKNDISTTLEYYRLALNSPKPDNVSNEAYRLMISNVCRDLCVIYFYKVRDLATAKQFALKRLEIVKDCSAATKVYNFCLEAEKGNISF
jgi:tetratricopeptide (TPR) repeat protein